MELSAGSSDGSRENSLHGDSLDSETRNYNLNKRKALTKKAQTCEREIVSIIETGGGVKILFNTGTYEVFKNTTQWKNFIWMMKKQKSV